VIGYEVQKVLALVDWAETRGEKETSVVGYGEGGLTAFYSAALDLRIQSALVSGYFGPRERLFEEPIYRNVFSLLREFGDAEIASLVAPRMLVIEYSEAPAISGPPAPRQGRSGAAPGRIWTPEHYEVEEEIERARAFFPQTFPVRFEFVHGNEGTTLPPGCDHALQLGTGWKKPAKECALPEARFVVDADERQRRQVQELVRHVQHQMTVNERERTENFWKPRAGLNAAQWEKQRRGVRDVFWNEVIGRFPSPAGEMHPRSRRIYDEPKWTGYEVTLDVWPNVLAWGILLVPKDLKPGERRPVVVCQHGLEGLPKDTIEGPGSKGYGPYKAFAARLAEQGFITFAPHNPYRGEDKFRVLQRKSNPLGRTLFSTIIGQHEQILNWLQTLPFVAPERIGFYGLSYGGKSAMRIPAVLDRYALSICSADFNDWVRKCATVDSPYSYMFSMEYDMPEFALGPRFNYAEMAAVIAPRPFMVERGHEDGVAPDEWVAYEFAKVRRFYDGLGIGNRAQIEFFNGPHTINGKGTFEFLREHLGWEEPKNLNQ
jgi:dienelactone hydrolase